MIATEIAPIERIQHPCAHCGEPTIVPADESPQAVFCCAGCRGAHELIQGWELGQFYDLRRDSTTQSEPARPTNNGCEVFDHPELLRLSSPREIGPGLMQSKVALQGLHCGACAWLIENAARRTPGWVSARVNMSTHSLEVTYRSGETSLGKIARLLARLGYEPLPLTDSSEDQHSRENRRLLSQIAVAGFFAANTMWIAVALYAAEGQGFTASHFQFLRWASAVLGFCAVAGPGRTFFQGALASIRTRTPH
ncbi:MAG: heavy metal translocating P-type ATPase metal-binding domain-containing protein, partial [Planctomycetota bacterium]